MTVCEPSTSEDVFHRLVRPTQGCQIDVTNVCSFGCSYCTRLTRHVPPEKRFFLSLEQIERALDSLADVEGLIGIMGGEPTLHPKFGDLCALLGRKNHPSRYGLWTSGGPNFERYRDLIELTFGYVHINNHKEYAFHQPLMVAINEVISDKSYYNQLIKDCWVLQQWGPSISLKGAFFCEVAATWDLLLDGPGGFPVEPGWFNKSSDAIREQLDRYCGFCGMALPLKSQIQTFGKEKISPGNLSLFRSHKLRNISSQDIVVFDKKFSAQKLERMKHNWTPYDFRRSPNLGDWCVEMVSSCRHFDTRGIGRASIEIKNILGKYDIHSILRTMAKIKNAIPLIKRIDLFK